MQNDGTHGDHGAGAAILSAQAVQPALVGSFLLASEAWEGAGERHGRPVHATVWAPQPPSAGATQNQTGAAE